MSKIVAIWKTSPVEVAQAANDFLMTGRWKPMGQIQGFPEHDGQAYFWITLESVE